MRCFPRIAVLATLLGSACLSSAAAPAGFEFFEPLVPRRAFQLVAPGGLSNQAPRSTTAAMRMAIEDGLEWIALDVRLTQDGQHVLFHDDTLDAVSDGSRPVKAHTAAQLKRLDAGVWFAKRFGGARLMTLPECFSLAKGKINVVLNCVDIHPELLIEQIKTAGVERQALVYGRPEVLLRVREISADAALMLEWQADEGFGRWLAELRPAVVKIGAGQMRADACRRFHARGIRVLVDALGPGDQSTGWDKVLAAGADFLQTEYPEEVVAHVLSRQITPRPVRFACHRGASRYAPENTLPAFAKAYRLHADFVEFDVRPSRDGKHFLLHDANLDRTTTGHGPIRQSDAAVIEGLDAGSWFGRPYAGTRVPSLDEFLAAVPEGVSLYFDAKDIEPEALAAALDRHHLVERAVVYQSAGYLEKLKQVDGRIRAMPPAGTREQVTALAAGLRPYAVDTRWTALSKEYIDHCHAAGIQVFADVPFHVNVDGYRQAIGWGIDLIQTDAPLRAWRAMELVAADRAGR